MRLLVALGLVALAASRAHADALVATRTADTLFIHHAAPDKLEKIFEEKGQGAYAYAWIDATLWVLRKDKAGGVTLGKVVDGKADATRPITGLATATPGKELPDGIDVLPQLATTRSGHVYVTICIGEEPVPGAPLRRRCKLAYHRADDATLVRVDKPPRDLVYQSGDGRVPRMPVMKRPPKGYGVKITKVKLKGERYVGFECKGPNGVTRWPTDGDDVLEGVLTPKVNKATWFATSPPVVHIEANGRHPMGNDPLYEDWYLIDCTTAVGSVRPLRDGLWLADDEVRGPKGVVVGKLPGTEPVVAP